VEQDNYKKKGQFAAIEWRTFSYRKAAVEPRCDKSPFGIGSTMPGLRVNYDDESGPLDRYAAGLLSAFE
jgi:hypothetical protein